MPRKTFRTTAKALLAIPSTTGARGPHQSAPGPLHTSLSMTLPTLPHTSLPHSCHSSPGNANDDDDDERRRSVADFPRLPVAPVLRPAATPTPPVAADERRGWKALLKSKKRYALVRRAIGLLHDNRAVSSKHPNTARRLRQLNAELRADTSHRVLKFILNAVFIVVGLLLLLSVLAAIGYTSTCQ